MNRHHDFICTSYLRYYMLTRTFVFILISISAALRVSGQKYEQNARSRDHFAELVKIEQQADLNPVQALERLDKFVKRNSKLLDDDSQRRVYVLAGKINYQLGQYDLSVGNYKKAIESRQSSFKLKRLNSKNMALLPIVWYQYAQALYANQSYQEAFRMANRYLESKDESSSYVQGLILAANILIDSGAVDHSFTFLAEAKALARELNDPELQLEVDYTNGRATENATQLDASLSNYQSALKLSDSLALNEKSDEITESIGRVFRAQENPEGELSFKISRREKSIADNNRVTQNTLDLDIASIYLDLDQAEEAIPFLQESVDLSEADGNLETNIAARKSLSNVYANSGDYNRALANYRSYVDLVDQQYKNKEREIALSAQVQKDLFERQQTINSLEKDRLLYENEIAILEQEKAFQQESLSFQRKSIYGLSFLMAVILIASALLYRSNRKKRIANQLLALKSLRSQMNPHFIFNALNSVNSFISSNEVRDANKYLTDFSRLMRIVMENSQKEFVPFEEEMEVLKLYLKLEHFRFQDQFQYDLTIDPDLEFQELRIPPMLAQPYIENAIWHGLRYKENPGKLQVTIELMDVELSMTICDDGIGRKKSQELKTDNQKKHDSTGMKNTQDRIDLLNKTYNSQIAVDVSDLDPGTEVSIHIPLKLLA